MRFLADESCDFVVTALRNAGHDVSAIVEINPGAEDEAVLALGRAEARLILTEDKDFGLLAYARGAETAGIVLIRGFLGLPQVVKLLRKTGSSGLPLPHVARKSKMFVEMAGR